MKRRQEPHHTPSPITPLYYYTIENSILLQVLSEQAGVVFARPAIVHRGMYAGRGIIAKNTEFSSELTDCRGYLPVEWWIMSCTEAKNAVPLPKEGVSVAYVYVCVFDPDPLVFLFASCGHICRGHISTDQGSARAFD